MATRKKPKTPKSVKTLTHGEERRKNIPTAEYQSIVEKGNADPLMVAYERRNLDLDPQLVWRGKDVRDWSDLVVPAPPLYIQEKVHPKVLIDDLKKWSENSGRWSVAGDQSSGDAGHQPPATAHQLDLFGDFNGVPEGAEKTEFYAHDQNWSNRMILGDSMQVMASLAEREGLRGKVQCIYLDPPYGIKFNSNFQWSTTSRDVKDGKAEHITREPEQVKAFRDTWRDGIHSYLTYLRDRLTVARELLTDSGSIFVQIGDENVHRVRALMDEVFGEENCCAIIAFRKTGGQSAKTLACVADHVVWYTKKLSLIKYRQPYKDKTGESKPSIYRFLEEIETGIRRKPTVSEKQSNKIPVGLDYYAPDTLVSLGATPKGSQPYKFQGKKFNPGSNQHWKTTIEGMLRLEKADRLTNVSTSLYYVRKLRDFPVVPMDNLWEDTSAGGYSDEKIYVVQTNRKIIQRCILMATDPGDLVLDPTCGSGTTAYVAEQWGRRWITIDTSRVALALARARIMGAKYPYYLLADSKEGQQKEGEVTRSAPSSQPVNGDIRHGFVYERVPHIMLSDIANNTEIDVIWDRFQEKLEPLREKINEALGTEWEEWEIPRELPRMNTKSHESGKAKADAKDSLAIRVHSCPFVVDLHKEWWDLRIARQKEIDKSIAAKADFEYLYDKPYEDKKTVRVAGPFTVESLSPHRVLGLDENDELIDSVAESGKEYGRDYVSTILDTLRSAGVQQAHKQDKIDFFSLQEWPGQYICAEGRYTEGNKENGKTKRAGIFIGPEFGTVTRVDLVAAAREAADADFDLIISCAFSYEAHTTDFNALGGLPVLKATMNADLHMAGELKNTGKGNLFVIFGEPDISVTGGQWLVAGNGKEIANVEIIKELSGLGSLEEINRTGRKGLCDLLKLSKGGKVRTHESAQAGGDIRPGEHRGGSGAAGDEGVSSSSQHRGGISGGSGDLSDSGATSENGRGLAHRGFVAGNGHDWSDDQRAEAVAAIQNLKESDFPLQLTTGHRLQVTVHGVDVFHPNSGEVRSDGPEGIACWFLDTDYNEESFFVRHAYFLGQNDPYKSLKTTLKAEIDPDAWDTLNSPVSRPFPKPKDNRIAVKIINHLGDEVMKVFRV